jgi:hypothetical protein
LRAVTANARPFIVVHAAANVKNFFAIFYKNAEYFLVKAEKTPARFAQQKIAAKYDRNSAFCGDSC